MIYTYTVCLYGVESCGHGYLLSGPSGDILRTESGDGEPRKGRSLTDCLILAVDDIARVHGNRKFHLRVFAPGGQHYADVKANQVLPYFGDLAWKPTGA